MQNLVFSGSGDGACVVADTFAFSAVRGLRVALVIDARGVAVLLAGELDLETAPELEQSNGHTLVLRRGPRQVQRLIELTGVGDRLTFEDD